MKGQNTTYMPRLDHLRFFAALLVVAYHYHGVALGTPEHPYSVWNLLVKEGETGVSLFMVLSGFILTIISAGKQIRYPRFILNRVIRIYPLYIFVVLFAAFGMHPVDFLSLLTQLSPIANVGQPPGGFPQTWTIPVEFQFYLAFPFLVAFMQRYGVRYIVALIAVMMLLRGMIWLNQGDIRHAAYWTIVGRMDQFAVGMLAAIAYRRGVRILSSPLALAAGAALVYAWIWTFNAWIGGYYGDTTGTSCAWIVYPPLEALVWAFFAVAYVSQKCKLPQQLDRGLSFLGSISFSTYVWHIVLLTILEKNPVLLPFDHWYLNFALVIMPVITATSALSYFVIERPFMELRKVDVKSAAVEAQPVERPAIGAVAAAALVDQ
jgi:peptidoglycan/LPS O-acetylase OafA/YrhL